MPKPARPNILLITTDQQQWRTIAGRSECRTPNLNRLAGEGLLFERSYTPCPLCCPARAMLLSGTYHWRNGVYNQVHSSPSVRRDMFPGVVTYPALLKEAGYRLGYVGKWHASFKRGPRDFGYEEVEALVGLPKDVTARQKVTPGTESNPKAGRLKRIVERMFRWPGGTPKPMWGHYEGPEEATNIAWRASLAADMVKRFAAGSQPWLMEVHFPEPHDAYMPHKEYLDRCNPDEIAVPPSIEDTFEGKPGLHKREAETWISVDKETKEDNGRGVTARDFREANAHYFAYCEELDAHIARIIGALDETECRENTLVVFTVDHGDMLGAHRMFIKGWIPYEECVRVPMIIRWPEAIAAGSKTDALVSLIDLAHTFVSVAGAAQMPYADGESLLKLFEDPAADWRDGLLLAFYGGEFLYTQRTLVTRRYKYVFNGFDIDECYDLEKDPHEMKNLVSDTRAEPTLQPLRDRLYHLMQKHGDPFACGGDSPEGGQEPNIYGAPRYLALSKDLRC